MISTLIAIVFLKIILLFSVGHVKFTDVIPIRTQRKYLENLNLNCGFCLGIGCEQQEKTEFQCKPLHTSTDFQPDHLREKTIKSTT